MKIIRRDRPQTVPYGELKEGDEFRFDLQASRAMRTSDGWTYIEGALKGRHCDNKESNRPAYPDPPREPDKVPYSSLPPSGDKGVTVFEHAGEVFARFKWTPEDAMSLKDGRIVKFDPYALVTPIDATLEY